MLLTLKSKLFLLELQLLLLGRLSVLLLFHDPFLFELQCLILLNPGLFILLFSLLICQLLLLLFLSELPLNFLLLDTFKISQLLLQTLYFNTKTHEITIYVYGLLKILFSFKGISQG